MKVIVELSKEDLVGYRASVEEIEDWFKQALHHSVDTWDGGLAFLDGDSTILEVKEV